MDRRRDSTGLSRREVLAKAAALAAAVGAPPWLAGCGGGSWPSVASAGKGNAPTNALVIGAGAAGLACAQTLLDAGVTVRVLEATTRRHGRVRSDDFLSEVPVELGAEVIRGANSVLYGMAVAQEADFATEALRDRVLAGGFLPTTEFLFGEADFAAAKAFADAVGSYAGPPRSIAQRIDDAGLADRTLRWLDAVIGGDRGTQNDRLDALALAQAIARSAAGPERLRLKDVSLEDVLDAEFEDVLPFIQYGTPIRHIDITGEQPVAYTAAFSGYFAQVIVLTIPLAILKDEDEIDFLPALPASKQQAIATIGVDAAFKAVLRFTERFWPGDIGSLYGLPAVAQYDATGVGRGVANDMLTATATGDDALALTDSSSPIAAILADLDGVFGAGTASGRFLNASFVDWTDERWFQGGVSYASVGSDALRAALAAPVGDRLFFAGEATSTTGDFGTLHGAIQTGIRAANEVLATRIV
jgi:monoamine oxidase